jgi:hypothetical protein
VFKGIVHLVNQAIYLVNIFIDVIFRNSSKHYIYFSIDNFFNYCYDNCNCKKNFQTLQVSYASPITPYRKNTR